MSELAAPPVVLSEARELLDAYRILKAAEKRISDAGITTDDAPSARRLGYLEHVLETAKDAVFDCLNTASAYTSCPASRAALDELQAPALAAIAERP